MRHDPKFQLESMVAKAAAALAKVPDSERASLLAALREVVFHRAFEARGEAFAEQFSQAFVNAVAVSIETLAD